MRYFVLFIIFTFSSSSFSQIGKSETYENPTEVGRIERYLGDTHALYALSFTERDSKTKIYVLTFTNENTLYDNDKIPDLRALRFTATQDEFDYLYAFLQQGFNLKQIRSLEVGEHLVKTITGKSRFLYINVDFKDGDSAMFRVSKRQLAKLFGKK